MAIQLIAIHPTDGPLGTPLVLDIIRGGVGTMDSAFLLDSEILSGIHTGEVDLAGEEASVGMTLGSMPDLAFTIHFMILSSVLQSLVWVSFLGGMHS